MQLDVSRWEVEWALAALDVAERLAKPLGKAPSDRAVQFKAKLRTALESSEVARPGAGESGAWSETSEDVRSGADGWPEELWLTVLGTLLPGETPTVLFERAAADEHEASPHRVVRRYVLAPPPQAVQGEGCETCNGHGYVRIDQPGLEEYGVEPESEPCPDCQSEKGGEGCGGSGELFPHPPDERDGYVQAEQCPGCSECPEEKR